MITVQEAIDITLEQTPVLGPEEVSLLEACGHILAEDVYSDIDMPPFDKSSMDGYAVVEADTKNGPTVLEVLGFIPAGVYPDFAIKSGQAAKIMTGAPMPGGADSVQMVEKTETFGNGKVKILESVTLGQHVARRGEVFEAGKMLIHRGRYLSPAVIGVLAAVGKAKIQIFKRPRVGILVTGDELVEVHEKPKPGQIRNSNGYALYHQVNETGAVPEQFGIASDSHDDLIDKIGQGLKKDVLLISGGVSMGDLDLVQDVFSKLSVQIFYNKVNIKPGKPTVFGRKNDTLVFGLPGNPVSVSTVFEVIAKPALRKMMGFSRPHNLKVNAILEENFRSKTRRETFQPAKAYFQNDRFRVSPISSKGSADILAFAKSNAFMIIPQDVHEVKKGERVAVMLRNDFWNA
jgi:molybdopterin molybdotransferase